MWFKVRPCEQDGPSPLSDNKNYLHAASHWLQSCTGNTHPQCGTYRKPRDPRLSYPSRLLYFPSNQNETVKLVQVHGQILQYATLSHRWGTPEPPQLSSNSDGHRKISHKTMANGIPVSNLPRIFREALQIIRHCGLEYLWIDSLCINQDSEEGRKQEWKTEAVRIGDIYTGGVFNIAAIDSENSDGRLFPEHREFFELRVRDSFGTHRHYGNGSRLVEICLDSDAEFERQVLSSELLSRGWVYQEVILAPANLFCTSQQMWWLCHRDRHCQNRSTASQRRELGHILDLRDETLSNGRTAIAKPGGVQSPLELWGELLRLYSKTSVTFKDDRLAAIAGLAKVFQSVNHQFIESGSYNSGFWSTNIVFQLSWRRVSPNFEPSRFTANHFIPSWSPISCKSELIYPEDNQESFQLPIQWTMNTSGLDAFGRAGSIEQCILRLRGVPIEMTLGPLLEATELEYEIWPATHPNLRFKIHFDNLAEVELAEKACSENGLRALILHAAHFTHEFVLKGILLRQFREGNVTTSDKWVRCGYLKGRSSSSEQDSEMFTAFKLARYGIKWATDVNGYERRVSTGVAPDLEDIYLV